MKHITFDLETLGRGYNAPIVQIAAVKFEDDGTITRRFNRYIDLKSIKDLDLQVGYETLEWWLSQDCDAIKSVFCQEEKTPLKVALSEFKEWVGKSGQYYYWSHATFDPPILTQNMRACNMKQFIPYRLFKDIRTLELM